MLISIFVWGTLGVLLQLIFECWCKKTYGYPSIGILITLCRKSRQWKWLSLNVWGDDGWYYDMIEGEIIKRRENGNG